MTFAQALHYHSSLKHEFLGTEKQRLGWKRRIATAPAGCFHPAPPVRASELAEGENRSLPAMWRSTNQPEKRRQEPEFTSATSCKRLRSNNKQI
mmetsp:Transcript_77819/g.170417  ORF Transcript_77819/g.170417 Transcript_77819/m.170417 type:complete len:94 (-) Transcript_77819:181-462(-)